MTRRRVTVALVAILVIAGAGVAWTVRSDATTIVDANYRVAAVGAGDVTETVAMNGTVTAAKHAEVNFPIAGSIDAVLVTAGQTVEAGTPLATLESSGLQAAVNAAQATYELALEQIDTDRAALAASTTTTTTSTTTTTTSTTTTTTTVPASAPQPGSADPTTPTATPSTSTPSTPNPTARSQPTANQPTATQQTTGQPTTGQQNVGQQSAAQPTRMPTEADIQSDIAAAYSAQIALSAAQEALARSILVAPISGVVIKVDATVGDQVAASTTATSSTAATTSATSSGLFVIEDQSGYSVIGTLAAGAIGQIHEGDSATVSVSTSSTDLAGAVTAVDRVPTTTNGTAVFTVTVGINLAAGAPSTPLYNGVNAKATIAAQHHASVMVVPTSAVHTSGGVSTVYVAGGQSDQQESRIVKIGAVGLATTEITSGLSFGDQVVLADLSTPIPTTTTVSSGNALTGGTTGNRRGVIRGN